MDLEAAGELTRTYRTVLKDYEFVQTSTVVVKVVAHFYDVFMRSDSSQLFQDINLQPHFLRISHHDLLQSFSAQKIGKMADKSV